MNESKAAASAKIAALIPLLAGGSLVLYSGTVPATADTPLSGNTVLVTFPLASPGGGAATLGANAYSTALQFSATAELAAASGTATFARILKSDGTTVVNQLTVGATGSGADITMATNVLAQNVEVDVTSVTINQPFN